MIMIPADLPPDFFVGERWAVDELAELTATVLVAEGVPSVSLVAFAQAIAHQGELNASEVGSVSGVVSRAEEADSDAWLEEVPYVLPVADLDDLFSDRWQGLASGGRRPLQEGDVFWVVLPREVFRPDSLVLRMGDREDHERLRLLLPSPALTREVLLARALRFRKQQAWLADVTDLAIEQVMRAYDSALQAGSSGEPMAGSNG